MSKATFYTQCRLCRPQNNGITWQVSWIPALLARVGQPLRLRIADESWQEGWMVESVWSTLPEEDVRNLAHLHLQWRDKNDG